jgi:hypothetical protein
MVMHPMESKDIVANPARSKVGKIRLTTVIRKNVEKRS